MLVAKNCEELGERDFERTSEPAHRNDTDVTLTSFDASNIIAVERGPRGQLLLGDADLLSQFAHASSDCDS